MPHTKSSPTIAATATDKHDAAVRHLLRQLIDLTAGPDSRIEHAVEVGCGADARHTRAWGRLLSGHGCRVGRVTLVDPALDRLGSKPWRFFGVSATCVPSSWAARSRHQPPASIDLCVTIQTTSLMSLDTLSGFYADLTRLLTPTGTLIEVGEENDRVTESRHRGLRVYPRLREQCCAIAVAAGLSPTTLATYPAHSGTPSDGCLMLGVAFRRDPNRRIPA